MLAYLGSQIIMNNQKNNPHTIPETFILESLTLEDERENRRDGFLLHEILKLHGKKPQYFYFRTEKEFHELINEFYKSKYRYLHLSCHGSQNTISYTMGSSTFERFAELTANKLNNRRLFVSGCNIGTKELADAVFKKNGGMYSITAPKEKVFFDQSISFWSAFYYMMYAWDSSTMKKKRLEKVLRQLSIIFEMPLSHFYKDTSKNGAVVEQPFTANPRELGVHSKSILNSFNQD